MAVSRRWTRRRASGLTIVELMIGVAIVAVLVAVAFPAYSDYRLRQRVVQAITDLVVMDTVIKNYYFDNQAYPETLHDIGAGNKADPWGRPYVYVPLQDVKGLGDARKNRNLVPINSDFDLYSKGRDGKSRPPLGAQDSRDDVIRANDGRYFGLASDYE
jgi:general secretion pathway protein G